MLRVNLSMALGSHYPWQRVRVRDIDNLYTNLTVPTGMLQSLRRKVARDFTTVCSSVPIYELQLPAAVAAAVNVDVEVTGRGGAAGAA
jgi:hypothetical protein